MSNARLYQFVTSPFCAKVRKILEYKGVEFEAIEVDYLERKELLLASAQIMVPALTMASGETIVGSDSIAMRLDELYPEPTILPAGWRGIHLVLTQYIDTALEEAMFRAALPEELEHFRKLGADRLAFYRLIRDRRFGAGFCDQMVSERQANWDLACEAMRPFDQALAERPFLLGRIGLADFALYGQLYYMAFTGELKIPDEFAALRAFFGRIDRMTAAIQDG